MCRYADLAIAPLFVSESEIICAMPEHDPTDDANVYLSLWDETKSINTNCTWFYYYDVIINSVRPDHISIHAHDNGVELQIRGLNFRLDDPSLDPSLNSLQVRVGEQVLQDIVEVTDIVKVITNTTNSTTQMLTARAPNLLGARSHLHLTDATAIATG